MTLDCMRNTIAAELVLSPDLPSTLQEERRGLVNIVQHFCTSTEFQQVTLKASLLAESVAMATPWWEAVLYLPDPPFLFGGGSGYARLL